MARLALAISVGIDMLQVAIRQRAGASGAAPVPDNSTGASEYLILFI